MATNRLPTLSGDKGKWGEILNGYLRVTHNPEGGINSWPAGNRPTSPDMGMTGINTTTDQIEKWNGTAWEPILNISGKSSIPTQNFIFEPSTVFDGDHFVNNNTGGAFFLNIEGTSKGLLVKAPLTITDTSGVSVGFTAQLMKEPAGGGTGVPLITYIIPNDAPLKKEYLGTLELIANRTVNHGDKLYIKITGAATINPLFGITISQPIIKLL
jgi:hypothetical protein